MTDIRQKAADRGNPSDDRSRTHAVNEGPTHPAPANETFARNTGQSRQGKVRPHVMAAYRASHERFAPLYEKLAKWQTTSR